MIQFTNFPLIYFLHFRHNQVSDLHKQNLEALRNKGSSSSSQASSSLQYRDRAKERRLKYGEDDAPKANRLKERYLQAMEQVDTHSTKVSKEKSIDSSNIGNKMLQKMGWKEGLGLGRSNQGRTSIIEVSILLSETLEFITLAESLWPGSFLTVQGFYGSAVFPRFLDGSGSIKNLHLNIEPWKNHKKTLERPKQPGPRTFSY